MRGSEPRPIYLRDYRPPAFLISHTDLKIRLGDGATEVEAELTIARNPAGEPDAPLVLDGHDLETLEVALDGQVLEPSAYRIDGERLQLDAVPDRAKLRTRVRIHPESNDSMEGLYHSGRMYCTQCEAEGFRRITWFLDRPDVLSTFRTTIEADAQRFPVLLANGNPVAHGESESDRHWACWENPFAMPCYLFAMVAGDLQRVEDRFRTMSGREITLHLYTEAENIHKTAHAMASLKRAMRWDEDVYGREYDLDLFMIVAVNDFNMGAMENKGLNIFNASCVLADPETATDQAFERIEAIVAHEYFHNWSGNRVTCRDWFQLSLKEGFTVFRDQCFSADSGSAAVKRINDVAFLRTAQFAEDAGPLAHPIRPDQYIEIANFYTLTVYEKGAEVVRMLHTLLGAEQFRRGSDLYFERHDGEAVTCDDFVQAMQDASGVDLQMFRRWYGRSGTPELRIRDDYDSEQQHYRLIVEQHGVGEEPLLIPLRLGLLEENGEAPDMHCSALQHGDLLVLDQLRTEFSFSNVKSCPVPALLRGFSAPVRLDYPYSDAQLRLLARHDSDAFVRWDAGQRLYKAELDMRTECMRPARDPAPSPELQEDFRAALQAALDADLDADLSIHARLATLPSEAWLAEERTVVDPLAIHHARESLMTELAASGRALLLDLYRKVRVREAYSFDSVQCGRRALAGLCLDFLARGADDEVLEVLLAQYHDADNMTDQAGALRALLQSGHQAEAAGVLDAFLERWQHDPLVVNQWLGMQACNEHFGSLVKVRALMEHPLYDARNPNKIRALIGSFCAQNPVHFHAADGSGYSFLAEQVLQLDRSNPQIAARLLGNLANWRRFEPIRAGLMKACLARIHTQQGLSRDSFEIAERALREKQEQQAGHS